MSADLLHYEAHLRVRAVEYLRIDVTGLFALRERLLDDAHGGVRAAAAERFARVGTERVRSLHACGGPSPAQLQRWLLEGLSDPLESVRERCCRALARHAVCERGAAVRERLELLVREDVGWRVRRAAVRTLATGWGARALSVLLAALDDPFWRVRHAIVQGLERIVAGAASPSEGEALRERISSHAAGLSPTIRAALAYLAGSWPGGESELPEQLGHIPAPGVGLELGDPDPAVVTARLLAAGQVDVRGLIRMLPEPHAPLRDEAARRLALVEEVDELWPALAWLEQPRVPHAGAEVGRLLARLGARAHPLAARVLAEGGRPWAERWALSFVATQAAPTLHAAVFERCASEAPRLRAAAISCLDQLHQRGELAGFEAALERALEDPDLRVREAAAWASMRVAGALPAASLAALSPGLRQRALELDPSRARMVAGLEDPDWRVRAAATQLAVARDPALRAAALRDADPVVAVAALDLAGARALLLEGSQLPAAADPGARRSAARLLVRGRLALDAGERDALQLCLAAASDAWLRARASELTRGAPCSRAALLCLLDCSCDVAPMVRLSASASLDELAREVAKGGLKTRLLRLLSSAPAQLNASTRRAAWSRLVVELDASEALAHIDAALASLAGGHGDEALRRHLDTLALSLDPERELDWLSAAAATGEGAREFAADTRQPRPTAVARRVLGSTGIELAPLVISGAHGPSEAGFAEAVAAGVDTVFWEPRHHAATRFLRQRGRDLQVIAGSFHADRESIEADVETACRLLRRAHIDVFLLFWVRSPARLSAEALATLRGLRAAGRIRSFGFSTHDRALACEAIETGDWPVIMTRHSAAHPGAEHELMPLAAQAGVGLLGFSALCYGRMLQPTSVMPEGPKAPDCYRYSLSQPGVAACISAPRRDRELRENLELLGDSRLEAGDSERLRAHGREVYADNARFNRLVRRGGAAPLREAISQLFERFEDASERPEPGHMWRGEEGE